ncbi:5364_t:CDS:2, partial [Scutellospora calospora]
FYRIINPEEIQHEKTLGGGLEKFAYHVEVVGGEIAKKRERHRSLKLEADLKQERNILQNDLTTLQNSTDIKILEGLNKEITDLKKQIQGLTLLASDPQEKADLEAQHQQELTQFTQNLNLSQQENQNLKKQLFSNQQKETELNKILSQKNQRINFLEAELNTLNQTLKETKEKAYQEQQSKQTHITQLQQDKTNLIRQVTSLTKTVREQLERLNQKEAELAKQKQELTENNQREGRSEIEKKLEELANFLDINEDKGGN